MGKTTSQKIKELIDKMIEEAYKEGWKAGYIEGQKPDAVKVVQGNE